MKTLIASLIAFAAMIGVAYASDVSGVVKSFDAATNTVTLDDGTAYVLDKGVKADGIKAGAKVTITFDDKTKGASAVAVTM